MDAQNVMAKVRAIAAESGLTQQVIGQKMGYPPKSARQSVSLFLKSTDPTVRVLTKFAKAMGVDVKELL